MEIENLNSQKSEPGESIENNQKSVKINESKNEDILDIEELPSEEQDKSKEISLLKLSTSPINETIKEEESNPNTSIEKKTIKISQQ